MVPTGELYGSIARAIGLLDLMSNSSVARRETHMTVKRGSCWGNGPSFPAWALTFQLDCDLDSLVVVDLHRQRDSDSEIAGLFASQSFKSEFTLSPGSIIVC